VETQGGWWLQPYPVRLLLLGTAELMGGVTQSESQVHLREWHAAGQTSLCHDLGERRHLGSLQYIHIYWNDHMALFWGVTLWVSGFSCFKAEFFMEWLIQKMKMLWSFGMSGTTNPLMQCHIPEDQSPGKTNCNSTLLPVSTNDHQCGFQ
jgi:hypothetical protein